MRQGLLLRKPVCTEFDDFVQSGDAGGVARNRMRTEAGNLPESLVFPIRNGLGVSNDRFGLNPLFAAYHSWRHRGNPDGTGP